MPLPDLRIALGSLTLENPVLVAAGTFGYGIEFARAVRIERLGALVTKTITIAPRDGSPPPRLVETPSGMLNAVGLANVGLDAFLRDKLPPLRAYRVPVIVSLLGETVEEWVELVTRLDHAEGASAIELNLSCPNLKTNAEGGMRNAESKDSQFRIPTSTFPIPMMVAQDAEATAEVVRTARARTRKPLIAKLSPDVTDLVSIASAAKRAGADALTLVNTFLGMSLDPVARRSRVGSLTGGVSGPAIRPLAVYRVWRVAQAVGLPIIGSGGIVRTEDALEFFLAGATAVAIGTANFANPRAALAVRRGLERYLIRRGLSSVRELIGTLQPA